MIGALRERIAILKPVRVPDEGGGYDINYTNIASVAAQVRVRPSGKDTSVGQRHYRRKQRFVIRRRDDLVFEMRLEHQGRRFRITDIQDQDQKGRFTLLEGEEITP